MSQQHSPNRRTFIRTEQARLSSLQYAALETFRVLKPELYEQKKTQAVATGENIPPAMNDFFAQNQPNLLARVGQIGLNILRIIPFIFRAVDCSMDRIYYTLQQRANHIYRTDEAADETNLSWLSWVAQRSTSYLKIGSYRALSAPFWLLSLAANIIFWPCKCITDPKGAMLLLAKDSPLVRLWNSAHISNDTDQPFEEDNSRTSTKRYDDDNHFVNHSKVSIRYSKETDSDSELEPATDNELISEHEEEEDEDKTYRPK